MRVWYRRRSSRNSELRLRANFAYLARGTLAIESQIVLPILWIPLPNSEPPVYVPVLSQSQLVKFQSALQRLFVTSPHGISHSPVMGTHSSRIAAKAWQAKSMIGQLSCAQSLFASVWHAITSPTAFKLSLFSRIMKHVYFRAMRSG